MVERGFERRISLSKAGVASCGVEVVDAPDVYTGVKMFTLLDGKLTVIFDVDHCLRDSLIGSLPKESEELLNALTEKEIVVIVVTNRLREWALVDDLVSHRPSLRKAAEIVGQENILQGRRWFWDGFYKNGLRAVDDAVRILTRDASKLSEGFDFYGDRWSDGILAGKIKGDLERVTGEVVEARFIKLPHARYIGRFSERIVP